MNACTNMKGRTNKLSIVGNRILIDFQVYVYLNTPVHCIEWIEWILITTSTVVPSFFLISKEKTYFTYIFFDQEIYLSIWKQTK